MSVKRGSTELLLLLLSLLLLLLLLTISFFLLLLLFECLQIFSWQICRKEVKSEKYFNTGVKMVNATFAYKLTRDCK